MSVPVRSVTEAAQPEALARLPAIIAAGLEGSGISAAMRAVLEVLHRNGPMTPGEIASRLKIPDRIARHAAAAAAREDLLQLVPNPSGDPPHFHAITGEGLTVLTNIRDREKQWLRRQLRNPAGPGRDALKSIWQALEAFHSGT